MIIEELISPEDFPAKEKLCYLNAASAALMYSRTSERIISWQRDLAENGTINFDERVEEEIFDDLHSEAATLFGAQPSDIAVGSSATELLSSLAWAMIPSENNNIVGTNASHPSTVYPWQRVARHAGCEFRIARANKNGYVDIDELLSLIDESTHVVAISHVEYRTGQTYDLNRLAERSHNCGAYFIIDATQSAGQVPIDVKQNNVDAIVSSAYKWLCGPFGVAVMYLAPSLQKRLDPGLVGWRSHKNMWEFRADRLEYPDTAKRFEASTMAYGCAIGLAEAIKYLNNIGVDRILAHNKYLADLLADALIERGSRILSPKNNNERSSIISVDFPTYNTEEIASRLNAKNIIVSYRMGAIRVSPHLYNDKSDIEKMIDAVDTILG